MDPRFLYPFSEAEFSARPRSIRESMNNLASVDSPSAKQSRKKDRCIDTGDGIDVAFQKKELFYAAHKPLRALLLDWCSFPCVPWDNTMRSIVSLEIVKHEKLAQLQGTWKKKLLVDESLLKDRRILAPTVTFSVLRFSVCLSLLIQLQTICLGTTIKIFLYSNVRVLWTELFPLH